MSEAWPQLDTPSWLSGGADLWDDGPAGELLSAEIFGAADIPPVLPKGIGTGHGYSTHTWMGGRAIWSPTGTYVDADGVVSAGAQLAADARLVATLSAALDAVAWLDGRIELQLVAMPWPGETYFGGHAVTDTSTGAAAAADLCEARAVTQYFKDYA